MGIDLKTLSIHITFAFLIAVILFAVSHAISHPALLSIMFAVIIAVTFFYKTLC